MKFDPYFSLRSLSTLREDLGKGECGVGWGIACLVSCYLCQTDIESRMQSQNFQEKLSHFDDTYLCEGRMARGIGETKRKKKVEEA